VRSGSALIDWKRSQRCRHLGFVHSYSYVGMAKVQGATATFAGRSTVSPSR
jgi:hypothetical protein